MRKTVFLVRFGRLRARSKSAAIVVEAMAMKKHFHAMPS
jgi:hypothetical protein